MSKEKLGIIDGMVLSEAVGHGPFPPRSAERQTQRVGALLSRDALRLPAGLRRKISVSATRFISVQRS